jgi:hypothetical protein
MTFLIQKSGECGFGPTINSDDQGAIIRAEIAVKLDILPTEQQLIDEGRILPDDQLLSDEAIRNRSKIYHMVATALRDQS